MWNTVRTAVTRGIRKGYLDLARRRGLPPRALDFAERDARIGLSVDPGPEKAVAAAMAWLCRAQDRSASADHGVARDFSLISGWAPSYPETTGYIVPTFLEEADRTGDASLSERGRRMLDWLMGIQFPNGAFQGGTVAHAPRVPVTFNTGQILIGLAIGARRFSDAKYLGAMHRAAEWLVRTQDPDGCWRAHPTPLAEPGEKTYETHASWGLFEAERTAPGHGYGEAGVKQVKWALSWQHPNGWFDFSCLNQTQTPLTHTIGYTLRGIIEAYRLTEEAELLHAAARTARGLIASVESDGRLPGRLDAQWRPVVNWVCLTGSVQIANSLLLLAEYTGDRTFLDAGRCINQFVRRTVILEGDPDILGGIRGSFPISGDYCRFEFISWGAKFFIDSNRRDLALMKG
jgi:hypothetical protein